MKFNWSHGHSTPKLVKVHGGALGDTYFKPTPSNYKVVWQVRNEDFFALRWGVPDFIRQHIALNGRQDYVGGYFVGSETYIPALDYFTAFERARVAGSGRFSVNGCSTSSGAACCTTRRPPTRVFQAEFTRRYGKRGENSAAGLRARLEHADATGVAV